MELYVLAISFAFALVLSALLSELFRRLGHTGLDVHKPCKVEVAESVGLSIPFSLLASSSLIYLAGMELEALAFASSVLIAALVGLVDDFMVLKAWQKIALGAIPSVPLLVLGTYEPSPLVPLDGFARLTIVYPLLLPLAFTVATNGLNMFDTHNGSMLSAALLVSLTMVFSGYMYLSAGVEEGRLAVLLSLAIAGAAAGMLIFNLYPARAFNGDVGSFSLGAAIAAAAAIGRTEAVAIIAALPVMLNGMLKITSVGFKERRTFEKPVELEGWFIKPKGSQGALSLPVLITSRLPLSEPELVAATTALTWITSLLALLTLYVTLLRIA
ncbi:MAG: hypothetical protein N3F67_05980 [Acidilobaceae archaeon]|nr:hypothetical protein [Acidilobaceae archaeon]